MGGADVSNVRALAGFDLVEAYDEALLVMARRESGESSMTLDDAERWHHGRRAARGEGPSRLGAIAAPTAAGWRYLCSVAVRLSVPARLARSVLDAADFAAVDYPLADMAAWSRRADRHCGLGRCRSLPGRYPHRRAMVAMLTRTPAGIIVWPTGQPDPQRNAEVFPARRATLIALCVVAPPDG